jgi:hypothetical protein
MLLLLLLPQVLEAGVVGVLRGGGPGTGPHARHSSLAMFASVRASSCASGWRAADASPVAGPHGDCRFSAPVGLALQAGWRSTVDKAARVAELAGIAPATVTV